MCMMKESSYHKILYTYVDDFPGATRYPVVPAVESVFVTE